MKQNGIYRGEWCASSHPHQRREELRRNHESEELKALKEKLDAGWQAKVTGVKHKRPRITKQTENFKVVMVFGKPMKLTIQEYNDHWDFTVEK